MIADIINNEKLNPVVTELYIRGRKCNISLDFITWSYFKVPKEVRLNSTHFLTIKIPNKRKLQLTTVNHSSDIDFKNFVKIYKTFTAEPHFFLVNDTSLLSDNPLRFTANLLNKYIIEIMTIDDQIRDEKLQYNINREAAKISTLSSGKIDKYEHLTGEELLPSNQKQIIKKVKFTYSPLGRLSEKQTKTIESQEQKQVDVLKASKPKKLGPIKDNKSDDNEKLLKNKEPFDELYNKRIGET